MAQGLFITFEGSEGCGKTTQIDLLAARLGKLGSPPLLTREPGGTDAGEAIRDLLQYSKQGWDLTSEAELLLFAASRAQLVRRVIQPALEGGKSVISDRFLDSTTVYQGVARRINPETVRAINRFAVGACLPDITFILDLEVDLAAARLAERTTNRPDRMESQPREFYLAVRDGYLALAKTEPERFVVIDGRDSIEQISEVVWGKVFQRLKAIS